MANRTRSSVVPAWLRIPYNVSTQFDIFRPLILSQAERSRPMGNFNYAAAVRVRRGVPVERALAEMNVVQARFPSLAGSSTEVRAALIPAHELVTGRARLGLWMLAAAVGAVLLIVCVILPISRLRELLRAVARQRFVRRSAPVGPVNSARC